MKTIKLTKEQYKLVCDVVENCIETSENPEVYEELLETLEEAV